MNVVVVIVVLVAVLCLGRSRLRCRQAGPYQRRIRPLVRRFVRRRRRKAATLQARELARAIVEDRRAPTAHLAAGVVLEPGEDAWQQTAARLQVRTNQPARMAWPGRRDSNVTRETATEHWQDHGQIDWLITSQRIVGRLPASNEMFSVWWSGLAGVDIDLESDRIVFNAVNGWTGMVTGPAVTPIAVAAVATCYGLEALLIHPALQCTRRSDLRQSPLSPKAEAVGTGGSIVRLPTRRTIHEGSRGDPRP